MRKLPLALALLTGSALAAAAQAAPSFTTIDNPADPTFNQLLGITDKGEIVGYFGAGTVGHPNKGYEVKVNTTNFVALNAPGSVQTQDTGINAAGLITGFWSNTNLGMGDGNFGFISTPDGKNRVYIDVTDPLAATPPVVAQVLGINKSNTAVGFYNDANGMPQGFLYLVKSAQYQPLHVPGSTAAAATGINDNNVICGFYVNNAGHTVGFTKGAHTNGVVTTFKVPGALQTQLLGINNAGMAVGFYEDANQIDHGLVYNATNGTWTQIDAPGGVGGTVLNGVNNVGQSVGFYTDAAGNVNGLLVNGL